MLFIRVYRVDSKEFGRIPSCSTAIRVGIRSCLFSSRILRFVGVINGFNIRSNPSKQRKITEKVDVWELGILMYYLAFYSTPFESVDGKTDTKSLLLGRFTFPANDARNFSREFLDLVKSMLTADVTKFVIPADITYRRPSVIDVIQQGCTMTRWRMTEEVKEALEYSKEILRRRSVKSKVMCVKRLIPQTTKEKEKPKEKVKDKKSPTHQRPVAPTPSIQHTGSSKHSGGRQPGPPALSDSDVSSSSDAEEIVQQKREGGEMTDRIRTAMLQYFGGRKNHTRWVLKCTSKVPEPPPHRTIKKIAIAAYENRSIDFYFVLVAK